MKNYRYCEERIIEDLAKIVQKYRKEAENLPEERITVSFRDNEYASYEEIQDAFGAGEMPLKTFDRLAKELKEKKELGNSRHIRENLENAEDRLNEIIFDLKESLRNKELKKEKELNRTEREDNLTQLCLAYMKLRKENEMEEK